MEVDDKSRRSRWLREKMGGSCLGAVRCGAVAWNCKCEPFQGTFKGGGKCQTGALALSDAAPAERQCTMELVFGARLLSAPHPDRRISFCGPTSRCAVLHVVLDTGLFLWRVVPGR